MKPWTADIAETGMPMLLGSKLKRSLFGSRWQIWRGVKSWDLWCQIQAQMSQTKTNCTTIMFLAIIKRHSQHVCYIFNSHTLACIVHKRDFRHIQRALIPLRKKSPCHSLSLDAHFLQRMCHYKDTPVITGQLLPNSHGSVHQLLPGSSSGWI